MTFFARNTIRNGESVYASTATFDGKARAMTEDEIRRVAPSVFAVEAHESRSERFRPIPTIEILRGLAREGFAVVGAKQSSCRQADRREHTKHLLRIRRIENDKAYSVGDTVFEMLLKNANDGTSVYDLFAGLFRICCKNSLVANVGTLDSVKVRHSGDVQTKVIEGTYSVLETAELALAAPQDWSQIALNRDERMAFAEAAHVLRFEDSHGEVSTPIRPEQLLTPRRSDDIKPNLWNVFNVVQEHVIKGGDSARHDAARQFRQTTTKEIKGIDQDIKLNKALWILSQSMAKLKQAA